LNIIPIWVHNALSLLIQIRKRSKTISNLFINYLHCSIVEITSKDIAEDWFGAEVFDIEDLHSKELEFEVIISSLKLREMVKNVLFL
jgi:hypothetical protein